MADSGASVGATGFDDFRCKIPFLSFRDGTRTCSGARRPRRLNSLALALGGEGRAEVSPQTPPLLFIQTSPSKNLPLFCSITLPSVSRTMLWSKSGA